MTHTALRREFPDLIDLDAPVEPAGRRLHLHRRADLAPASTIICCSPTCRPTCAAAGTSAAACARCMRPSNKCNGMTYDADLDLIVCEHATSSLIRERDGRREVARLAFRGQGAQQPERRLRALRRLDLFLRPLVRPHAGLRRRAAAPARLPGRLPRAAGRRRAAASRRPQPVRSAERALLLAGREAALRQRHRAAA